MPRFSEAQTTQTWGGGSGQWDTGSTADWTGNTTWSGGYDNGNFTSTPGTITVSGSGSGGPVTFDTLTFGGTGPWLIQGAGIEKTPFSTSPVESTQVYTVNSGTGNVTINSTLTIGDIGVNHHAYITDDSTSAFSEGNINFTTYTANPSDTNTRSLDFNLNNTTGSISLTGTYTTTDGDAGGQGAFYFGDQALNVQANYYLTSTADFTNFDADSYHGNDAIQLDSGNLHIATSKFSTAGTQKLAIVGNANNNQTVDIEGAQTIGLGIYDSMKNSGTKATDGVSIYGEAIVNQNTANASTWSGNVVQDGTNLTLSAVSGGRLTVSGQLQNSTPQGLTIAGSGTVVLSSSTGNSYNENDGNGHLQPTTNASATLETGSTTLITNTSGVGVRYDDQWRCHLQ